MPVQREQSERQEWVPEKWKLVQWKQGTQRAAVGAGVMGIGQWAAVSVNAIAAGGMEMGMGRGQEWMPEQCEWARGQ